jgi:putative membrane protein
MQAFLLSGVFAALGFWVATYLVGGLQIDTPVTLLLAGLLLALVNAFIRPIATILTLPITLVTLGLFLLVVNAAMVGLVAWLLPGMHVASFWSALGTTIIVSVVGWIGQALVRPR